MTRISTYSISLALLLTVTAEAQLRRQAISISLERASLRAACDTLIRRYAVPLVYRDSDVDSVTVSASCVECTVEQVLSLLVEGTGLAWERVSGQYLLVRRAVERRLLTRTVSGTVRDAVSGEDIEGAHLLLLPDTLSLARFQRTGEANRYGFFSLRRVPPGTFRLVASAVGYHRTERTLTDSSVDPLVVELDPDTILMREFTIEGERISPMAGGGELSHGVYFRSAPSDQTRYLLDGAGIYNPAHVGGLLSTFNADALNEVEAASGGIPPRYGGHLGGILDIALKEGTMERLSGTAGGGSSASHLTLEGPLTESSTFVLSGRGGYPDLFLRQHAGERTLNSLRSGELIAKVNFRISAADRLFVSGYAGEDSYDRTVAGAGSLLDNRFSWGNRAANLRWTSIASPSLFLEASAVYTRYACDLDHRFFDAATLLPGSRYGSTYGIDDVVLRADAEHFYDDEHTVRGGAALTHHRMSGTLDAFSLQASPLSLDGLSAWELAVYFQDQWRLLPGVTAEIGARATNFAGSDGSFSGIEPRFSLRISLGERALLWAGLTSMNEFMHPYRNSGVLLFYPATVWYPSTNRARPTNSLQCSLGAESGFGEDAYVASAGAYVRLTRDLHEFPFTLTPSRDLTDDLLYGTGKVYGITASLRKRFGSLTGSLHYNLSWTTHQFAALNGGEPYAARLDRRHELELVLSCSAGEHWVFGGTCAIASDQSPSFSQKIVASRLLEPLSSGYADFNGSRLPGFQRLELKILHQFSGWGLPVQTSLRLVNDYGLLDPFAWEINDDLDPRLRWRASVNGTRLFPLYPVAGMSVRF